MYHIKRSLKIWWAAVKMFVQDSFVYRANAFIWMLTDVVTAVTMPLIWLSSFNGRSEIHGFTPSQMVAYYLVVLTVGSLVESHVMWEVATEVKQGRFNVYLIRPMSFMSYMFASNVGWRLVRTFVGFPAIALVIFAFRRYIPPTMHVDWGPAFWVSVILAHIMSFMIAYTLGLLSLWLYETRSLFSFYYLPSMIFSGQIAPIALFPSWLQLVFRILPFQYTLAFPAEIFLRRISEAQLYTGFAVQIAWIAAGFVISAFLWRGGLKRYTAFGI